MLYYLNLSIIIGFGILLCEIKPNNKKTNIYLMLCTLTMTLLFTFRYGIGYDFYNYKKIFESISGANNFLQLLKSVHMRNYPLFAILNYLISFVTNQYWILNAVLGLIIYGLLGVAVKRFSPVPWVSIFCYVTLSYFYLSMNFVRQAIAMSLLLFAYPFLKQRRFIPFSLVVVCAGLIHFYALILLPAYFFLILKPSKKHYGIIGITWLVLFMFSDHILGLLSNVSPRVSIYLNTIYMKIGNNERLAFIPIICFIVLLAFQKLLISKDQANYIFANFAFYGLLFSMTSIRHAIIERFAHYFLIFLIFAFPEIASCLRPEITKQSKENEKAYKLKQKSQMFNYRWYLASLVFVLMINQAFCNIHNLHGAFPYHTLFDTKWVKQRDYIYYEIGNEGWPLKPITLQELPEELR